MLKSTTCLWLGLVWEQGGGVMLETFLKVESTIPDDNKKGWWLYKMLVCLYVCVPLCETTV